MNAVLVVVVILSIVILVGNTMIAVAFLRNRRGNWDSARRNEQDALDELHRRVQDLDHKRK